MVRAWGLAAIVVIGLVSGEARASHVAWRARPNVPAPMPREQGPFGAVNLDGRSRPGRDVAPDWAELLMEMGPGPFAAGQNGTRHEPLRPAPVPEPASVALFVTGMPLPLVVLGLLRRRRRAAAARRSS